MLGAVLDQRCKALSELQSLLHHKSTAIPRWHKLKFVKAPTTIVQPASELSKEDPNTVSFINYQHWLQQERHSLLSLLPTYNLSADRHREALLTRMEAELLRLAGMKHTAWGDEIAKLLVPSAGNAKTPLVIDAG